ncbi:MAG: ATP synthase F1 subunit epsilon [Candidatus Eremiobacteraeota bacterium]|nr:ATP synthase F1 subunit epsilon [Candidatus Eremiobacteraeota bacterium]
MPTTTAFSVVTPAELKFEGQADIVVAPGSAGDLAALVSHAPLLTTLRIGVLRANVRRPAQDGKAEVQRVEFAVTGGFMEILPDKVVVLTDVALAAVEIDTDEARAELKQAEEALVQKRGADDAVERRAVAWACAKLETAHHAQR